MTTWSMTIRLSKWSKQKKMSEFGTLDPKNIYFDILEAYIKCFKGKVNLRWSWPHKLWPPDLREWSKWKIISNFGILDPNKTNILTYWKLTPSVFCRNIDFQWSWPHDPWPSNLPKWSKWKKMSEFGILDPKNIYFDILEDLISI